MSLRPCTRSAEIRSLLAAGQWPHACPPDLVMHGTTCTTCANLVLLTQAFLADRALATAAAQLPPPGLIWWRAQLHRRNAAIERISRPLFGAHIFALSLTAVVALVFLISQLDSGLHWLTGLPQSMAVHRASLWSSLSLDPASWAASRFNLNALPPYLLPTLGLVILLASLVVYLTAEKQ